jgi:translocation and assembly module TamB
MAHRSNQAVASQEEALPKPPLDSPPPRRFLIGWATALAALGVSTALVAFAVWLVRMPLADFIIEAALSERGVEADLRVVNLDLERVTLAEVRFGAESDPDAQVALLEATWDWRGLTPVLRTVQVIEPRLRLRLDRGGRISAGALDRLRGDSSSRRRPTIPEIALRIVGGEARIDAPFGLVTATFQSDGVIGDNFSGAARIPSTTLAQNGYSLTGGEAELVVVSREDFLAFRLNAAAPEIIWSDARIEETSLRALGRVPLNLERFDIETAWRASSVRANAFGGEAIAGALGAQALFSENSLSPANWQAQARMSATSLQLSDTSLTQTRLEARVSGDGLQGESSWTAAGDGLAGLSLISRRQEASGAFTFDLSGEGSLSGDAQVRLAGSRLDDRAQRRIREAFPDLASAPIGPTFASAERALDRAADAFEATIPVRIAADGRGPRFSVAAPIEARARSGLLLRFAPLRDDAPALLLQWPGPMLHGAAALELSGGGAPNASLLLDTIDWSPGAPFEAEGTLALSNWRAENASIAAEELGISVNVTPEGHGALELRGPARITGPLGDGEVRDLVAELNVTVAWDQGWRVTPSRGCLPVRMGGLDAAGLSFSNGDFALCALNNALIAADANSNLSGGFIVRSLALHGRMAGPDAQAARLSVASIVGRFGGRTGDTVLALDAQSPHLAIDMAETRALNVAISRLTANAHIADSWRIEGEFAEGTLSDPSLPGSVSTIAGGWSAAPEDDAPVIRVQAGAALLTANRPESDEDRPLFNPLRLAAVNAVLRGGEVDADGAIVLDANAQQLARFDAHHDVSEGVGQARVRADRVTFGPELQPYDITEQARGMVESVRGDVALSADINWTRDAILGSARAQILGVSLATSTIPVVNDVRGEVYFDDAFALTTPPGQHVTIGELNPGVSVRNGRVSFQLLPEERVAIEQAEFDFASGTLAMSPTTIALGADETRFELTLRNVDATALVASLNIPDLSATGQVEGSFPLLLTRRTAFIEGGVLRAQPGGGIISYTGNAGTEATGPARIAFDALRSFRYDNLALTLDGDLNGEVLSSITFSGRNTGEPVDLGEIAPVPGLGNVTVRGVPFDFNVTVSAPFRRLAQTAATITDPGSLIDRATGEPEEQPPESVDPNAPGSD